MARDGYNRKIDYLRISVTDKCDLGCIYCAPGGRPRPAGPTTSPITLEEIVRIVNAAVRLGVRQVRITGGEPLVRPDIVDIAAAIFGAGAGDLSLTTNGLKLAGLAEPLKRAGVGRLNISLDSMEPERYSRITGGGDLHRALEGIEAARAAGLDPVKINMVPIRGVNDDEIPAFARMTLDSPMHVRFIEFMPAGDKGNWDRARCVTSEEARHIVQRDVGELTKRQFKGKGPSRNYRIKDAKGIVGFISALSHSFCYCCNRLRVTSRGRIRPCLFSNTEIDVLTPMRKGADDDEILRLLGLAISAKPAGDYLKQRPEDTSIGPMSSIGG